MSVAAADDKLKPLPQAMTRGPSNDYSINSSRRASWTGTDGTSPPQPQTVGTWSSSFFEEHRTLFVRPPHIGEEHRKLVQMMQRTRGKKSWFVPILFCCAAIGKLILGFGASLAIKGHYDEQQSVLIAGAVLAGLGFVGCVAAAIGFGAGIARTNKKKGILFKCISITGACFIGLGYTLNSLFVQTAKHGDTTKIRLSFLPLMVGTALMSISLPNFVAYSELLRGRIPYLPPHRRPLVAMCFLSPWIGSLFAGWVSGEHAQWQQGFNAAVLTFSVASVLFGVSLFWANHIRAKAEQLEIWIEEDDLAARIAAANRNRSETSLGQTSDLEKPLANANTTMIENVAVPTIQEPQGSPV